MNKSLLSYKSIVIIRSYRSNIALRSNLKGTNMNIQDLIKTQSISTDASDYDFDLPLNFNTSSDDAFLVASSERNGAKYIAKPYTICGEVNNGFYAHYIPFKKEIRATP